MSRTSDICGKHQEYTYLYGSAKQEESAENSLLRNITKFDEKTLHIQKFSEPQQDKYKESCAQMQYSQSVDKEKILNVARET